MRHSITTSIRFRATRFHSRTLHRTEVCIGLAPDVKTLGRSPYRKSALVRLVRSHARTRTSIKSLVRSAVPRLNARTRNTTTSPWRSEIPRLYVQTRITVEITHWSGAPRSHARMRQPMETFASVQRDSLHGLTLHSILSLYWSAAPHLHVRKQHYIGKPFWYDVPGLHVRTRHNLKLGISTARLVDTLGRRPSIASPLGFGVTGLHDRTRNITTRMYRSGAPRSHDSDTS